MKKALGRCARKHVNVVEYDADSLPAGTCKCGETLIEWAIKRPTQKES